VVDRFDFSALASVRPTIVLLRTLRCPRTFGRLLPLLRHWPCSVRKRKPEHPCGTPCRTVRRSESLAIPSLLRVTLSATSEHWLGLLDSRQSLRLRRFLRLLPTEAPSLHRRYPVSSVLPASRHLIRPGLALTRCQLIAAAITAEASRVSFGPLCLHAVTTTPAVTDRIDSLVLFHRLRPSPSVGRVGSCISCFGACSVLLRVRPA
jgi:hypothetical protein